MAEQRLVIFDFDGTLADSRRQILDCARQAFEQNNIAAPDEQRLVEAIGLSLPAALRASSSIDFTPEQEQQIIASYRAAWLAAGSGGISLFAGIEEVLRQLKASGHVLAIATSKSRSGVERAAREMFEPGQFDVLACDDDVEHGKPAPEMVERILSLTGIAPGQALMVGDTEFDIAMGVAAGVRSCGVSWGSHSQARLLAAGASWVVDRPQQILEIAEEQFDRVPRA